jgi:hypothetical protein
VRAGRYYSSHGYYEKTLYHLHNFLLSLNGLTEKQHPNGSTTMPPPGSLGLEPLSFFIDQNALYAPITCCHYLALHTCRSLPHRNPQSLAFLSTFHFHPTHLSLSLSLSRTLSLPFTATSSLPQFPLSSNPNTNHNQLLSPIPFSQGRPLQSRILVVKEKKKKKKESPTTRTSPLFHFASCPHFLLYITRVLFFVVVKGGLAKF